MSVDKMSEILFASRRLKEIVINQLQSLQRTLYGIVFRKSNKEIFLKLF